MAIDSINSPKNNITLAEDEVFQLFAGPTGSQFSLIPVAISGGTAEVSQTGEGDWRVLDLDPTEPITLGSLYRFIRVTATPGGNPVILSVVKFR